MVERFTELSDSQQKNIYPFLDKAQNHELSKIRNLYQIKGGQNLIQFRENVLHGLMMEEIEFNYFINWLNEVYLESNNTLFVYEPDNISIFEKYNKEKIIEKAEKIKTNIFDINIENLTDIELTNVKVYDEQLVLTLVSPCFVIQQKIKNDVPNFTKDIFLAYITIDYTTKQFVLSMPPISNLYSLNGIKKKKEMDEVSLQFIKYFKKQLIPFNSANPDWIIDALFDITEEYFDHNNPIITKKLNLFKEKTLTTITTLIADGEEMLQLNSNTNRIKKEIIELYERQLIATYGIIEKETVFKIFFNESGKGVTSFRANARGKALDYADSYEIVKKMIENADIASIGITYIHNGREFPYKIVKENAYYSLKRISKALTEKEIVDNVLRQLKKYKSGEEFTNTTEEA
ncbi:Uncharacterised protein [Niallia circulans]|uniref:hypothetical protein n=1 Tax=Niallia circulans TaxID=1397 RepID=UPI00077CA7D2|nr:hypothetical protein [Niallia circulans]MDR4317853.1 hypothetical protein [Niallia circulans]MED3841638.1 hypothetical protein [Niallia circulans]MED4243374.1 hypothetical protein [Niallia circulans]MED4248321.1 hypothetical protein [Niallia circulans]QKH62366.1 hypothetical protein FOC77_17800 [Niallia circulans]